MTEQTDNLHPGKNKGFDETVRRIHAKDAYEMMKKELLLCP
jgi:hypothetical protein